MLLAHFWVRKMRPENAALDGPWEINSRQSRAEALLAETCTLQPASAPSSTRFKRVGEEVSSEHQLARKPSQLGPPPPQPFHCYSLPPGFLPRLLVTEFELLV